MDNLLKYEVAVTIAGEKKEYVIFERASNLPFPSPLGTTVEIARHVDSLDRGTIIAEVSSYEHRLKSLWGSESLQQGSLYMVLQLVVNQNHGGLIVGYRCYAEFRAAMLDQGWKVTYESSGLRP